MVLRKNCPGDVRSISGADNNFIQEEYTIYMVTVQDDCLLANTEIKDESGEQSIKAKLSVLTNRNGPLNKAIDIDDSGAISKTHSHPMTNGVIQRYDIDFSTLGSGLSKLTNNQCFCHGVVTGSKSGKPGDENQVVTAKQLSSNPEPGMISRTHDFMEFRRRHISMLDYDPDEQCPHAYIAGKSIIQILEKIDPQWGQVGYWLVPSSSAGLCLDGKPLDNDHHGYHLYFQAENAENLRAYMDAIFKVTVIAGHGWIKLSSNGAMHVRSCFDGSVYSPERIDFTAPPTLLSERLSQKRPEPDYHPGKPIDCSQILEVDEVNYRETVEALKKDSDLIQRSKELAEKKAAEISEARNISLDRARQLVHSRLGGKLNPEDIITFKNLGDVPVADVMLNHDKYNQESCADPCEPEQGTSKAMFFANDGVRPLIHSMLHGGKNYYFPVDPNKMTWSYEDAELTVMKVDLGADTVTQKGVNALAEDILLHNKFTPIELDSMKTLMNKKLKISKGAITQMIKAASVSDEPEIVLTHWQIANKYIAENLKPFPSTVGSEGGLWVYAHVDGLFKEFPLTAVEDDIGKHFSGQNCKKGSDYKAIGKLVYNRLRQDDFFDDAPLGIPTKSKFIRAAKNGAILKEAYTPEHRQRFKLPVDPVEKAAPRFEQYLIDTFGNLKNNPEIALLQQMLGGLVSGTFGKIQRAVLLKGGGSNGKSVLLELLGHMFPTDAKTVVSPHDLDNEHLKAELCGKIINIVGELDAKKPLRASFKDIISCDTEISARKMYKDPFRFKPRAGHIFASNHFPQTDDHTPGFYRRWVILNFANTVPDSKKIPNLGAVIAKEELPQVLAWAIIGAEKLVKNGFKLPLPASHDKEMKNWKALKDSVYGFLSDEDVVEDSPGSRTSRKEVYAAYCAWCRQVGMPAEKYREFISRVDQTYPKAKWSGEPQSFKNMRLK